jgi:PncC family amidohydrolase
MTPEEQVGRLLMERKMRIAVAESCTGGLIAHRLTNIPGASEYFEMGIVTYSNSAKERFLSVPGEIIGEKGAVSAEVARLMADGVRRAVGAELGLSATGIAGPGGGSPGKPVGTVFIGLSWAAGGSVRRLSFEGDRKAVKAQTSDAALRLLLDYLEGRLE